MGERSAAAGAATDVQDLQEGDAGLDEQEGSLVGVVLRLRQRIRFQKPFRLTQSLAVSTSPNIAPRSAGLETIAITGTLTYQACDIDCASLRDPFRCRTR